MAMIADAAGVSVPTVSKVLNGRADVAPETRERVERLLAEHGYQRPAGSRRRARLGELIDLVINELDSAWAVDLVSGVEEVAESVGLSVVVSAVHSRSTLTRQWLDSLTRRGSQGVILVLSQLTGAQREELERRAIPFVFVDAVQRPDPDVPSVGTTNWNGGFDATHHLISLGHRRIAAIGGPPQVMSTQARLAGYRAALEAAGLPGDADLVRFGDFRYDGGFQATVALMDLAEPPTAIFAGSDLQALGAIQVIRQRGLQVPDDVSVVGFDDLVFSSWTAPPLTTVRQPLHEMGAAAARTLLSLMQGEKPQPTRIELATSLVVRESTAPPSRRRPVQQDRAPA
jgi:DNA-binding LacI/PurR family transcriptional regulator